MITRQTIIDTIHNAPEPYLGELYDVIKNFIDTKKKVEPKQSLMAKLRKIKISAPSDFSQTADLHLSRDKSNEEKLY